MLYCPHCRKPGGHPATGAPVILSTGERRFAGSPRATLRGAPICLALAHSMLRARVASRPAPAGA